MEYFIVRIYRRDEDDRRRVSGLVETVGVEGTNTFHSSEELWSILCVSGEQGHTKRAKMTGAVPLAGKEGLKPASIERIRQSRRGR
jgi:hypothetical protein